MIEWITLLLLSIAAIAQGLSILLHLKGYH